MNIAIFADLHGRLELCLRLCRRWQMETEERLDLILQAGDLGAFFDARRIDRATLQHAKYDPTEVGFLNDFAHHNPQVSDLLNEIDCPFWLVRGNHEDHAELDARESSIAGATFPIDVYGRIQCLKTGVIAEHTASGRTIRVLGIGRIGAREEGIKSTETKYIQPFERQRLRQLKLAQFDILLTHDSALDMVTPGFGMLEINDAIDRWRPPLHFYGHTGESFAHHAHKNGVTDSYRVADLHFEDQLGGQLAPQSFGLLRWGSSTDFEFETISASWTREYNRYTWNQL